MIDSQYAAIYYYDLTHVYAQKLMGRFSVYRIIYVTHKMPAKVGHMLRTEV